MNERLVVEETITHEAFPNVNHEFGCGVAAETWLSLFIEFETLTIRKKRHVYSQSNFAKRTSCNYLANNLAMAQIFRDMAIFTRNNHVPTSGNGNLVQQLSMKEQEQDHNLN